MKRAIYVSALAILVFAILSGARLMAQEKTSDPAGRIGHKVLDSDSKVVANAEIIKATVILSDGIYIPDTAQEKPQKGKMKSATGEGAGPAEKTQFDVILKSKVKTDENGEFLIKIPSEQFRLIPPGSAFKLKLQFKLPVEFGYSSDEATARLEQKTGPAYELVLTWKPAPEKTNKGTFAVSSKAQT